MPSRVTIDIQAQDNASATLDSVRSKLQIFDAFGRTASDLTEKFKNTNRVIGEFDVSASKAARGIRSLVGPMIGELSPALGQVGGQMASIITTAAALGSGLGAVALGSAALAGIVGGKLVTAWTDSTARKREFDEALRSGDIARTTTEIEKMRKELDELGKIQYLKGGGPLGLRVSETVQADRDATREKIRQQAASRDQELLRQSQQEDAVAMKAREDLLEGQRLRLLGVDRARQARGLNDPALDVIERTRAEKLVAADDLQFRQEQPEAAQRARERAQAEYLEAVRQRHLTFLKADAANFDEAVGYGGITPDFLEGQQRITDRIASERLGRRLEAEGLPGYDEGAGYGDVRDPRFLQQQREISERITTDELTKQLELTQSIATLNAARTDLSLDQRESLSLQAIEHEKILKLQVAGNDQAKIFGAEMEAALKRQQLLEATDAGAGFRRGLTDVEVAFGSAGLRMQETARTVGGDFAHALSDSMFGEVEERIKGLPPLVRSMLASLTRAITDDLGKAITAQLFSGLKGLLPGGGTPGLVPFADLGAGSGGGPPSSTSITLNVAGRPLPESELRAAFNAGGEAGLRALQQGRASVVGGQFVPDFSPEFSQSAFVLPSTSPNFLGHALPLAAGAAGLGLSALGATGAQSGFDVGASGALGALTGAGLGRSLGNLFPSVGGGAGAAGGALAGAAINTTLALLAKQAADRERAKERQAAEFARATGAGENLVSSAGSAQSLADLFRRITAFGSGAVGGTASPAVGVTVDTPQGARMIGRENPTYPVASLADLIANPSSLKASIQQGVGGLEGPNAQTSTALQQIATDMVAQFREREQGVGVTEEDRMMPSGLRRRTTVPASRAEVLADGGDLELDGLALAALSDDDRAAVLLDVLGKVASDRDIVSTVSDGATGQIVSVTRIPRSTVSLPPGTTPPPAPVTPPAPPPPSSTPSTGEILTTGGLIALGTAAQLADPNSLLNSILPSGFTGGDLANFISQVMGGSAAGSIQVAPGVFSNFAPESVRNALEASGQLAVAGSASVGGLDFGDVLSGAGGLAALFNLFGAAREGDPIGILQSVSSLYGAISNFLPAGASLGNIAADAFISLAPQLASTIVNAAGAGAGGVATTALTVTAAEVLASVADYIPVIGTAIAFVTTYLAHKEEMDARASGWWNNPIRGALNSASTAAVGRTNTVFNALGDPHNASTGSIKAAVLAATNNLPAYYATAQGGLGAVRASDSAGPGTQSPEVYAANAARARQSLVEAVQELMDRGATYEELGALPVTGDWAQASLDAGGRPFDYLLGAPGNNPLSPRAGALQQEGGALYGTLGGRADEAGSLYEQNERALAMALGGSMSSSAANSKASGLMTSMYGGPFWAAMARMGLFSDLIAAKFDPWVLARTWAANSFNHPAPPDPTMGQSSSPGGL